MSDNADEIMRNLRLGVRSIAKNGDGLLTFSVDVENNNIPDVPSGVQMTVDGIFRIEIKADGITVGTANLILPTFGVICGTRETVEAYWPYYLLGDVKYRVRITPVKLWIMEV